LTTLVACKEACSAAQCLQQLLHHGCSQALPPCGCWVQLLAQGQSVLPVPPAHAAFTLHSVCLPLFGGVSTAHRRLLCTPQCCRLVWVTNPLVIPNSPPGHSMHTGMDRLRFHPDPAAWHIQLNLLPSAATCAGMCIVCGRL